MSRLLAFILSIFAKLILRKYHPTVIGITGSVGKTSTKQACLAALGGKFRVRVTAGNYNTEIGVPLTIIGGMSGGDSIMRWLPVFVRALQLIFTRDPEYPDILILEFGADRPGDIARHTRLTRPKIGVISAISSVHTEYFGSEAGVAREKSALIAGLPKNGLAILNADAMDAPQIAKKTKAPVVMYGIHGAPKNFEEKFVAGSDLAAVQETGARVPLGMRLKVSTDGTIVPIFLPNVIGLQHASAALAACAVGRALGLNLVDIAEGLRAYVGAPGRMHVVVGIKETLIIDDTYNASPRAMEMALEQVALLKPEEGAERIAVLGDMLELGAISKEAHEKIGALVARLGYDLLMTVGPMGKHIEYAARQAGMDEHRIAVFDDADSAGKFVQEKMETGDIILVKGSRGIHMERIVREIMAEPLRAEEILVH